MDHLLLIASPFFALLIGFEAVYDAWRKTREYAAKDTLTNMLLVIGSMIWGGLWIIPQLFVYTMLSRLTPLHIPSTWWAWILVVFLDDFAYYWFHRVSHESRLFWNFHVVHHSSHHYNLSVAVRQSWFGGIIGWIFYAPLVLLGFSPTMVVAAHGINLIYQFWIHTKFIKSLGVLEQVLNTPAHHRVHHGVNEPYLDKNYAGMLIIWDRMFGTFVPETEEPRYGIIKPVQSYNPLWLNLHAWAEMVEAMRTRSTIFEKLRCIWGGPGMEPAPKSLQWTKDKALQNSTLV